MIAEAADGIELSVHVRKRGSVDVDHQADFAAEIFLPGSYVVEVSVVGESRHESRCVLRITLGQRIERADGFFVAGFFGCLVHKLPFQLRPAPLDRRSGTERKATNS